MEELTLHGAHEAHEAVQRDETRVRGRRSCQAASTQNSSRYAGRDGRDGSKVRCMSVTHHVRSLINLSY